MNLDDLRVFLAVHRAHSLSEAARALRVSVATVGRRVDALEEALGTKLFLQTRDGQRLTAAGERILAGAERIELEAASIEREVGEPATMSGVVRVTAGDAMAVVIFTSLLAAFQRQHPALRVELVADNRLLSLAKREVDVAIRLGESSEPMLVRRKLCDFAVGVYGSPAYVEARGPIKKGKLEGHDFIGLEHTSTFEEGVAEALMSRVAFRFKTTSTLAQLQAIREGLGIGLLPCYLADPDPGLVRVVDPDETMSRPLWIVVHRDTKDHAHIRACTAFFVEAFHPLSARFAGRKK